MRLGLLASVHARRFSAAAVSRGLFQNYVDAIKPTVKEISPKELNKKLTSEPTRFGLPESTHVLDVRETYEWNERHIPYAIYTGRGTLERDIEGLIQDPSDTIIVYCAGGVRSILAADALQKMGYKNVYSLEGGIGKWVKEGLPVNENYNTYSDRVKY